MIDQNIILNMLDFGVPAVTHGVYGDTGRTLNIYLRDYHLIGSETATVYIERSDGTHYVIEGTVENEHISIDMTQMLTSVGDTKCNLNVSDGTSVQSYEFIVTCHKSNSGVPVTPEESISLAKLAEKIDELEEEIPPIVKGAPENSIESDASRAGALAFCWSAVSHADLVYTFTLSDGAEAVSPSMDIPAGAEVSIKADYSANYCGTLTVALTSSSTQAIITLDAALPDNWTPENFINNIANGYLWFPEYAEAGAVVIGDYSMSLGYGNAANEEGAVALGYSNVADGRYSFVSGRKNKAGYSASAEGSNTSAKGIYSHTEGYSTIAKGMSAHAEGTSTEADGNQSHAEGIRTYAAGNCHAEGSESRATGTIAHAEGSKTKSTGTASHSEGVNTESSARASHSEGENTKASGNYTHAEGYNTEASGNAAHAEGSGAKAIGNKSHAEGTNTAATGDNAHTEGNGTITNYANQHAQGKFNASPTNTQVDIVGWGTNANNRKNISTLDTDGNLHLKGKLFENANDDGTGGTPIKNFYDNEFLVVNEGTGETDRYRYKNYGSPQSWSAFVSSNLNDGSFTVSGNVILFDSESFYEDEDRTTPVSKDSYVRSRIYYWSL